MAERRDTSLLDFAIAASIALSPLFWLAGVLFLLAVAGLLGYRIWKQQAFLKQVRTSRLDPVESLRAE